MLQGVFDHAPQIGNRDFIGIPEIDTSLAGFDLGELGFEQGDMMIATGVKRYVLFLIGQSHPTLTDPIGEHGALPDGSRKSLLLLLVNNHTLKKFLSLANVFARD